MPNTINSQPAANKLMSAYRPIISAARFPGFQIPLYFNISVASTGTTAGWAVFSAADLTPFSAISGVTTITFGNSDPSINGTRTLSAISFDGNIVTMQFGTALPAGRYAGVTIAINSTTLLKPGGPFSPQVVYCDVYFGGVYYKTFSKTQPKFKYLNGSMDFEFDIQDAAQEYLTKFIPDNGSNTLVQKPLTQVFCRYRSSTTDGNGFNVPEGAVPVQETGTIPPTAGGGTQGNTFYVVNAILQHTDNQDLETHLSAYKIGFWDAQAYPLTHRPNGYRVCPGDSDTYPLIWLGTLNLKCLGLEYKLKGSNTVLTASNCGAPCIAPTSGSISFPAAEAGTPYTHSIALSGSAPFTVTPGNIPAWMSVTSSGTFLEFTGTPSEVDVTTGFAIDVTVNNCSGTPLILSGSVAVTSSLPCTAVSIPGTVVLNDAYVGIPFTKIINLAGTGPFTISDDIAPTGLSLTVVGGTVVLSGTPTTDGADVDVSFTLTNACGTTSFAQTMNVIATARIDFDGTTASGCTGATVEGSVLIDGAQHGASSGSVYLIAGDHSIKARARFVQASPIPSACLGATAAVYLNDPGDELLSDASSDGTPATVLGDEYSLHVDAGDTILLFIQTTIE